MKVNGLGVGGCHVESLSRITTARCSSACIGSCLTHVLGLQVKYVREATHVRAKPPRNAGAEEMVPLERVVGQVRREQSVSQDRLTDSQ